MMIMTGVRLLAVCAACALAESNGTRNGGDTAHGPDDGWVVMFNGRDLSGWETNLGVPPDETEPLGRGRDPRQVFSVVTEDGEPAIRISGEIIGGLSTRESYADYHLELEFKWGERRFTPCADLPRDSGLLYYWIDDLNPDTGWMESLEFGILEGGETGDFWSVPGTRGARVMADVTGEVFDLTPAGPRLLGKAPPAVHALILHGRAIAVVATDGRLHRFDG